jgi:hypothetical protein
MHRHRIQLVLVGFFCILLGCAPSPPPKTESPPSIQEQVQRVTPGLQLEFDPKRVDASGPYALHRFSYRSRGPWPYGEGFAVVSPRSKIVLWVYLHHGDFPPHEIRWARFDEDDKPDLFFHAGYEDVAGTYVFVDNVAADAFGLTNFIPEYENKEVYAVVLDFEGDGRPELLEPEAWSDVMDDCASEFQAFERSSRELREEYQRLAGPFDSWNLKFGVPEDPQFALSLFERVTIKNVARGTETEQIREHMRWRVRTLLSAKPRLSASCRERVDGIVAYLEETLGEHVAAAI